TPFTFIATAEVVALLGATPVFVDIDPVTYNIDPAALRKAVEDLRGGKAPSPGSPQNLKPRGVIPVDLFGLPADYDAIQNIAKEHGLFMMEDAAQSMGGMYQGKKACGFGDLAATSFFPAKPLGGYGDGGAVFTNNPELSAVMDSIRVHGKGSDKYDNVRIGINGRLDTLQAAILLAKLDVFEDEVEARQRVAARYSESLKGLVGVPVIPPRCRSAWAQYSVQSDRRDALMEALKDAGVPTAIHYPKPLHLQGAFKALRYPSGSFPVSERTAARIFSLPMHPYLEAADSDRIIQTIRSACGKAVAGE
ncbi:MAG: DegT/DnrJ/EryC1/StrS family aminotransferase, partial [Elusimicrobia bacterium]|nr:DegT/DnrJ/EryC1/StrS family aminotransferase [Elusimicrobiota bacterium]